jgi:hypothetical protein
MFRIIFSYILVVSCTLVFFATLSNASITKIAQEVTQQLPDNITIAIQPIDSSGSGINISLRESLINELTNQIQLNITSKNSFLVDRSKIEEIMLEQEEFQNIEEFSKLLENTGADALVALTVSRKNANEVNISARVFGVKDENTGKVLAASNTYSIISPQTFIVKIDSILEGAVDRSKYQSSLVESLGRLSNIQIVGNDTPNNNADYVISISVVFSSYEKATEESKKAEESAKGMETFNKIAGNFVGGFSMGGNSGGGIFDSIKESQPDPETLKAIVYTADLEAYIYSNEKRSNEIVVSSAEVSVLKSSSDQEKKRAAVAAIKDALSNIGNDIGTNITGFNRASNSPSSLLD